MVGKMIPDFSGIIWMFITLIISIIFVSVFLLFVFWFMPPISRTFIRIKWSKSSPAFIQHGGRVSIYTSDQELPEGVIHNQQGWFLKSTHPYKGETKRSPGRPRKDEADPKEEVDEAINIVLRTPILDGLGKQVFFGSADTPLISNLETLAEITPQNPTGKVRHSLLNILKEIIPATISRTQLEALATLNYLRGLKVGKGEMMRLIILIVCLIALIATVGIVFYFIAK